MAPDAKSPKLPSCSWVRAIVLVISYFFRVVHIAQTAWRAFSIPLSHPLEAVNPKLYSLGRNVSRLRLSCETDIRRFEGGHGRGIQRTTQRYHSCLTPTAVACDRFFRP